MPFSLLSKKVRPTRPIYLHIEPNDQTRSCSSHGYLPRPSDSTDQATQPHRPKNVHQILAPVWFDSTLDYIIELLMEDHRSRQWIGCMPTSLISITFCCLFSPAKLMSFYGQQFQCPNAWAREPTSPVRRSQVGGMKTETLFFSTLSWRRYSISFIAPICSGRLRNLYQTTTISSRSSCFMLIKYAR